MKDKKLEVEILDDALDRNVQRRGYKDWKSFKIWAEKEDEKQKTAS